MVYLPVKDFLKVVIFWICYIFLSCLILIWSDVVKNVMKVQIGADGTFTTAYYAPAYNPATGQFHNQTSEKVGNCPYIDVFANFQWKTATIFLKFTNANQGWPNADYFSAYHYIKPKRAFKVGIFWPFFVK